MPTKTQQQRARYVQPLGDDQMTRQSASQAVRSQRAHTVVIEPRHPRRPLAFRGSTEDALVSFILTGSLVTGMTMLNINAFNRRMDKVRLKHLGDPEGLQAAALGFRKKLRAEVMFHGSAGAGVVAGIRLPGSSHPGVGVWKPMARGAAGGAFGANAYNLMGVGALDPNADLSKPASYRGAYLAGLIGGSVAAVFTLINIP